MLPRWHLSWRSPPCAHADEASRKVKTRELFVLMHLDQTMAQTMEMVMKQVGQMTQSMPGMDRLTPEQSKLMEEFQKQVETMITSEMGWKAIEPDFVDLYARNFTEEEIDGILAFYKSPVGQALVNKTPELTTQAGQITQARMVKLQPKINAMMEDFMKRLMATTTPPKKTAPATRKN